jgi:hypothetical protein
VSAADGVRLATLNPTDPVHNRGTLNTNLGSFNGSDDAEPAVHIEGVLVAAIVRLITAVLLLNYRGGLLVISV